MTENEVEPTAESSEPPAPPKGSRRRWIVAAVVVAVLAAGGIAAAVANSDDDPTYDSAQIGRMHQACQQWADSHREAEGPDHAWCTSMADWMAGRMGPAQGRAGMMGSTMWQDPDAMQATCQQWMASHPDGFPTGADATTWCNQMVDWMAEHMGDWDQWMGNGPMMGGS